MLYYIILYYVALHYITLHYITLHYITLHYITLHCITLHYITSHHITLFDSHISREMRGKSVSCMTLFAVNLKTSFGGDPRVRS